MKLYQKSIIIIIIHHNQSISKIIKIYQTDKQLLGAVQRQRQLLA